MLRALESATKVQPAANSFFPMSMAALSRNCPWFLCIVIAYISCSRSCCHDREPMSFRFPLKQ